MSERSISSPAVPEGFMTMKQAQFRLGIGSKATMVKIVRERGLTTYDDPRDARRRLLKSDDVERVAEQLQPRPRVQSDNLGGVAA